TVQDASQDEQRPWMADMRRQRTVVVRCEGLYGESLVLVLEARVDKHCTVYRRQILSQFRGQLVDRQNAHARHSQASDAACNLRPHPVVRAPLISVADHQSVT